MPPEPLPWPRPSPPAVPDPWPRALRLLCKQRQDKLRTEAKAERQHLVTKYPHLDPTPAPLAATAACPTGVRNLGLGLLGGPPLAAMLCSIEGAPVASPAALALNLAFDFALASALMCSCICGVGSGGPFAATLRISGAQGCASSKRCFRHTRWPHCAHCTLPLVVRGSRQPRAGHRSRGRADAWPFEHGQSVPTWRSQLTLGSSSAIKGTPRLQSGQTSTRLSRLSTCGQACASARKWVRQKLLLQPWHLKGR